MCCGCGGLITAHAKSRVSGYAENAQFLLATSRVVYEAELGRFECGACVRAIGTDRWYREEGDATVNGWLQILLRWLRSDDGPTATEYGVLIALIAVAVIGALSMFGEHMGNLYGILNSTLSVFS